MTLAKRLDDLQFDVIFQPIVWEYQRRTGGPWWKPAYWSYFAMYAFSAVMMLGFGLFVEIVPLKLMFGGFAVVTLLAGIHAAREFQQQMKSVEVVVNPVRHVGRVFRIAITVFVALLTVVVFKGIAANIAAAVAVAGFYLTFVSMWCEFYFIACNGMSPQYKRAKDLEDAERLARPAEKNI
jgi:hypothetical protein